MTNPTASKVLDRVLVLEMVRVTEAAAIAASKPASSNTAPLSKPCASADARPMWKCAAPSGPAW